MIQEAYVSFEVAKLLKEKGFNELCNRVYQGPNLKYTTLPISPLMSLGELGGFHPKRLYVTNDELGDIVHTAPTQQMAMAWLREVHNKYCDIGYDIDLGWFFQIIDLKETIEYDYPETKYYHTENETGFNSYEQASEAAIKYCLENLI